MKIYLASMFADKPRMKEVAAMLEKQGHTVVSRWIYRPRETYSVDSNENRYWAKVDAQDVADCDLFVAFSDPPIWGKGQGARHTELGLALAVGMKIVGVGEPEQLFHFCPEIVWVADVEDLLQYTEDCQYLAWLEK